MLENIEGDINNGQSRETGNIGYTRRRWTKQKYNTICDRYHYAQTNINNVNTTWALLQTSGRKDGIRSCASQHGTQNVKTHNRTKQKTKKMSTTDPTKKNTDELSYSRIFGYDIQRYRYCHYNVAGVLFVGSYLTCVVYCSTTLDMNLKKR
jgi:hypothetical protein